MKKIKKIFNIVASILTGLLLLLTLLVLIIGIKANSQNKIPTILGYTYSTVSTPSMVPVIEVGDIIITKNIIIDEVKVEDIIVFYSNGEAKYIVHRVIRINEDGSFITKGDANPSEDPGFVNLDNYVGKVIRIIPRIGNIVLSYRNILFGIIILIFLIIIITEIINIIKNINSDHKNKLEKQFNEKYNLNDKIEKKDTKNDE